MRSLFYIIDHIFGGGSSTCCGRWRCRMGRNMCRVGALTVAVATLMGLWSCSSDKPDNIEPQLLTLQATDISRTEATLRGRCAASDATVTPQLWFCYGSDESMAEKGYADATTPDDDGTVALRVSGLTAGTTYYYMLQGSKGAALLSADMLSFTTLPNNRPTVGAVRALAYSPMSLIVGYTIADNGGDPITESGCYVSRQDGGDISTEAGKELKVAHSGSADDDGVMRLRLGGLAQETSYIVKPYAVNRNGEDIGEPMTFTTSAAVMLEKAGQLAELIGNDIYNYTHIALAGPLNGTDLRTVRDMAGRDSDDKPTDGRLADIDLSGAQIVEGGVPYAAGHHSQDDIVGTGMFAACSLLQRVLLPQQTTGIEADAFKDCTALRSITVPASTVSVAPSSGCTALEEISVSEANTHYASHDGVLFSGDGKTILWFPMNKSGDFTLPPTVTTVGDYAFRDCKVERFVIADGLTEMGQCVFYNSMVKEVTLPSTLRQVPTGTFQKCSNLTVVRLGESTEIMGNYLFDGCPLTDIYISAPTPPVCNTNTFTSSGANIFKTCRLHVAKGSKLHYKYNSTWGQFSKIVEDL